MDWLTARILFKRAKNNPTAPADTKSSNHLGNVTTVVSDRKVPIDDGGSITYEAAVHSAMDYYPFGSLMTERTFSAGEYRYGMGGHEKDDEVKGVGNHISFNDFGYNPRLGKRWRSDPHQMKFPGISPYAAFNNNPIMFTDPDGKEPIRPKVGTAATFRAVLDNSPRRVGHFTGQSAHNYLLSLGNTEFKWKQMRPLPTQTGYFNDKVGRYIYTEQGGWVDMVHFLFYAGRASQYLLDGVEHPFGEAVQDGFMQERLDQIFAKHSAFSYEDLPSNKFGADFAVNHFDPDSELTFGQQVESYLINVLGATNPESAPNFDILPEDYPERPTRTNRTTTPVFTKDNP
jgi:RHS repeat-associated protein